MMDRVRRVGEPAAGRGRGRRVAEAEGVGCRWRGEEAVADKLVGGPELGRRGVGRDGLGRGWVVGKGMSGLLADNDGLFEAAMEADLRRIEAADDALAEAEERTRGIALGEGAGEGAEDDDVLAGHKHEVVSTSSWAVDHGGRGADAALGGEASPGAEGAGVHGAGLRRREEEGGKKGACGRRLGVSRCSSAGGG